MDKARIFIVEDEGLTSAYLKQTLESYGYTVTGIAQSGEEALKKLGELGIPDLMMMDIRIKGSMTGIDVVKKIRESSDVPVIYLTADLDESILDKAEVTKPSSYIIKPFEDKELFTNIEMALYRHKRKEH